MVMDLFPAVLNCVSISYPFLHLSFLFGHSGNIQIIVFTYAFTDMPLKIKFVKSLNKQADKLKHRNRRGVHEIGLGISDKKIIQRKTE